MEQHTNCNTRQRNRENRRAWIHKD